MNKNIKKSNTVFLVMVIILILIAVVCVFNYRLMQGVPFLGYGEFKGPTAVFGGVSGKTYVIDNGQKNVLVLDQDDKMIYNIRGGSAESGFYYAFIAEEGADGSIYIADVLYSGQGTRLSAERIFRYGADGRFAETVYELLYDNPESAPLQYGRIQSLTEIGNILVFVVVGDESLLVCSLDLNTKEVTEQIYELPGYYINYVAINPETLRPVFTTRFGEVCGVRSDGSMEIYIDKSAGETPWQIYYEGQKIIYTDLGSNTLFSIDTNTGVKTAVIEGEEILYTVHEVGEQVYTTDYIGCYIADGDTVRYIEQIDYANSGFRIFLWILASIGALIVLALIILKVIPLLRNRTNATFQRVIIVVLVSVSIGATTSVISLTYLVQNQNDAILEQLNLFCDILVENTETEILSRIDSLNNYRNEDYLSVKKPLDALTRMSYANGLYYYYIIYVSDGDIIYGVMDYEDTMTTKHPFYLWGTESYTEVLSESETIMISADVSSYGSWSFVLKPVPGADGSPAAIMEVGVNLDELNRQNRALVMEITLAVSAMALILLMIIIESIFFIEYTEEKRNLPKTGINLRVPLRTIIFLVFLADCMQDAFISILANKLYEPFWGIPQSVGAALPLSAEVLAAAITAFACGFLARRFGVQKTLMTGLFVQASGFIICGVLMDYYSLLIGKAVIGAGMGLVIVSLNSIAAHGDTESMRARTFMAISAGTLAGVSAGSGVGSLVLSFGSYSTVFYIAAVFMGLAIIIAYLGSAGTDLSHRKAEKTERSERMSVLRYLKDFKSMTFLLLILSPFLIGLSFREYLFPIYAAEAGMSEVDIGRIFLLFGLVVIYIGPPVTQLLIDKIGTKWTVISASVIMSGATLLFAFKPSLTTAVIGIAMLSLAVSFGYTAQSTYYAGLPVVKKYGESQAMGVYSLFDNGGQTLGPAIYGFAMLAGYHRGLFGIGIICVVLVLIFALINLKSKEEKNKGESEHE